MKPPFWIFVFLVAVLASDLAAAKQTSRFADSDLPSASFS